MTEECDQSIAQSCGLDEVPVTGKKRCRKACDAQRRARDNALIKAGKEALALQPQIDILRNRLRIRDYAGSLMLPKGQSCMQIPSQLDKEFADRIYHSSRESRKLNINIASLEEDPRRWIAVSRVSESFPEYALPLNALLAGVDQVMCNIYGSHYVPEGNPVVIYCAEESATAQITHTDRFSPRYSKPKECPLETLSVIVAIAGTLVETCCFFGAVDYDEEYCTLKLCKGSRSWYALNPGDMLVFDADHVPHYGGPTTERFIQVRMTYNRLQKPPSHRPPLICADSSNIAYGVSDSCRIKDDFRDSYDELQYM